MPTEAKVHDALVWDPAQYLRFAQPRMRPAIDLLARIDLAAPATICDLGCGTGNVTRVIAQRWPQALITGVDGSAAMLEVAGASPGPITWQCENLAHWRPESPVDLIYSNAALHWLPDHADLFPRLIGMLAPGGVLAVQMPRNFDAPSHSLIAEAARAGPWQRILEPLLGSAPVAPPQFYHRLIKPLAAQVEVWETEYLQVLEGADPVKEWVKGTWLRRFLDALPASQRADFEADYAERLREAYPPEPDGTTLFPFRRLFLIATVAPMCKNDRAASVDQAGRTQQPALRP